MIRRRPASSIARAARGDGRPARGARLAGPAARRRSPGRRDARPCPVHAVRAVRPRQARAGRRRRCVRRGVCDRVSRGLRSARRSVREPRVVVLHVRSARRPDGSAGVARPATRAACARKLTADDARRADPAVRRLRRSSATCCRSPRRCAPRTTRGATRSRTTSGSRRTMAPRCRPSSCGRAAPGGRCPQRCSSRSTPIAPSRRPA